MEILLFLLLAVIVLLVASRLAPPLTRVDRPEVGRFPSPGSLPRARGFDAAAERHFGNPGTVRNLRPGHVVAHTPWPECP